MLSRKIIAAAILFAAVSLFRIVPCHAHGVSYEIIDTTPAISFKSGFSSGEPIAYGEVTIYSPDDREVEFQNGRTDKNGVFSFMPDRPGVWKIEVLGGMGHKLMFDVDVLPQNEKAERKIITSGKPPASRTISAVLGVSLLLNLALGALFIRSRKHAVDK
ncbi:hypothetical protein [Maridesulfovibrio sp.]|uniref:hypothetical protein n=1 Tax=Maridesulfovibrio sp. TaxID=2795000 RepID=UPI002A18E4EB|nr:hypothetical protein [Maridesulfovibrio sp.]